MKLVPIESPRVTSHQSAIDTRCLSSIISKI